MNFKMLEIPKKGNKTVIYCDLAEINTYIPCYIITYEIKNAFSFAAYGIQGIP